VPAFITAQILGGALAVVVIWALYPRLTPADAAEIIVPHHQFQAGPAARAAPDGGPPAVGQPPRQPR
jgi:hypothetical protein